MVIYSNRGCNINLYSIIRMANQINNKLKFRIMKKLSVLVLGITLLATSFISCSEDDAIDCNCGLITSDNVQNYSVTIRNNCSGNEETFVLSQGDWMNAHPGSDYCITNISNW